MVDFSDPTFLETYYLLITIIFTFLIYWYVLRKGFVLHRLQKSGTFYREIDKKKVSFKLNQKDVKFGNEKQGTGKSYFVNSEDASYSHRGNIHIYFDDTSMKAIRLMKGKFNPSSAEWYNLFEAKLLNAYKTNSQVAPQVKASFMSHVPYLLIGFIVAYAFDHFFTGGNLFGTSPVVTSTVTSTTTSISTSVSTSISSVVSGITRTITG